MDGPEEAGNRKVMSMAESWNVRDQFNKQATKFNKGAMTQDKKNHQFLLEFYNISAADELLDFACGTGTFATYAAQRAKSV